MKSYRYTVVDVFTTEVLEGNALAVFPDASDLDATTMQKIAREFNLAETAFVLPATRKDCAATLRIFTPAKEMVFAGHPTVGSASVLLHEGIVPKNSSAVVVEEKIGPVPIRNDSGARPMIWLRTPPIREGRCYASALCAAALGLPICSHTCRASPLIVMNQSVQRCRRWCDGAICRRCRAMRCPIACRRRRLPFCRNYLRQP